MLKVENLSFSYDNLDILKEISFTLEIGDFVGILGPNGCGKTTLLKNINRWLQPNQGNVYIDGFNILNLKVKDLAKRVASVLPRYIFRHRIYCRTNSCDGKESASQEL